MSDELSREEFINDINYAYWNGHITTTAAHDRLLAHDAAQRAKIEALEDALRRIGDMAVVDFDDKVVGLVDDVVPYPPPKTYFERRKAELAHRKAETERIEELEAALAVTATWCDRCHGSGEYADKHVGYLDCLDCADVRAALRQKGGENATV